ncbi:2'-5' RNA ligase family protein [Streptomyces flavofungini]|uniref:2'-5' RNA ligase family protein n=1 Tax=Streptomyces flavofungini TaxID=68200 RepID=UPI0034DE5447
MHSVELLPDETTERAVTDVWRRLRDAGLPSQAAHRHPTNRPHLTLATADALPAEVRARLRQLLAVLPVPLRLEGVVRFTGRRTVVAWSVRADEALSGLHEAVWRTLADAPGCGGLNPLHAPGRWRPHITLARGREGEWPASAAALLSGASTEQPDVVTGRWVRARTYDSAVRTVDDLAP